MNHTLTLNRRVPNPSAYELPKLQLWNFPPITHGVEGFELIDRYRSMLKEARQAQTAANLARRAIADAAAHDADAESDALIAKAKLPNSTVEKAIDTANEAHRNAYRLIVAANKVGMQAVQAVSGKAGTAFADNYAKRSKAAQMTTVNHLDAAADSLAEMIATAGVPQWVDAVASRGSMDAVVGRSLPSYRPEAAALTTDGRSPMALLDEVRALVVALGGEAA